MQRLLIQLLQASMILCATCAFVGCGDDDDDDKKKTTSQQVSCEDGCSGTIMSCSEIDKDACVKACNADKSTFTSCVEKAGQASDCAAAAMCVAGGGGGGGGGDAAACKTGCEQTRMACDQIDQAACEAKCAQDRASFEMCVQAASQSEDCDAAAACVMD